MCVAVTACTSTVSGSPTAAGPDSRVGRNVAEMLPTPSELTELTGVDIEETDFPPSVGKETVLPNGLRDESDATEIQCLGVTQPGMRRTYDELPGWAVAAEDLDSPIGSRGPSVDVSVTVVALTSDAAAVDAMAEFADQWRACEGKTMVVHDVAGSGDDFSHRVDEVAVRGELLTAAVTFTGSDSSTTSVDQRALGIGANCVVDVEVGYFDPYRDTTAPSDLAERVAETVLDKIADAT